MASIITTSRMDARKDALEAVVVNNDFDIEVSLKSGNSVHLEYSSDSEGKKAM